VGGDIQVPTHFDICTLPIATVRFTYNLCPLLKISYICNECLTEVLLNISYSAIIIIIKDRNKTNKIISQGDI